MISRNELMHHRLQAWMRENKCDDLEKPIVAEYFQRCFAEELEVENS